MPKLVDAVFEGGGVRGIGLVGAAAVVEEQGYTFENVAGTSAGAIVASLIAAGYSAKELTEIMRQVDYSKFTDPTALDRIPVAGPIANVLADKGIYKGDYFEQWLRSLLEKKGVTKFGDLVLDRYKDDPRYRYRLQVVASDISAGRLLQLPRDAAIFGIKPDELEVARAVRMSMSIPLFYEPVKLTDGEGRAHYIVDGGLLSNFPVWIFDDGPEPRWPTFGFRLVDGTAGENDVHGVVSFLEAIVKTMLTANDNRYVKDDAFVRTIPVPTLDVGTTDFALPPNKRDALYQSGRSAAEAFLKEWDFERYKAKYRKRTTPSRGAGLRV